MTRSTLLLVALTLAACTSASAPSETGTTTLKGTLAGQSFAALEAVAIVWDAPVTCANPEFAGWTMAMVQIAFQDVAGSCDVALGAGFCAAKARSRGATIAVFRANVDGGPVPPIGPGTYTDEGTHVVDANGVVRFLWLGEGAVDSACTSQTAGMPKEPLGGTLRLDEVGPTRVRGQAELRFDNGDVLSGPFDAPICPVSAEAQCLGLKGGCAAGVTCVP